MGHEQRSNGPRSVGRKSIPVRLSFQHQRKCVADIVGFECTFAGQRLVEHAAKRPDVGALVRLASLRLFRRKFLMVKDSSTGTG